MPDLLTISVVIIVGILWFIVGNQFILSQFYNYKITHEGVCVRTLGLYDSVKIPFNNIRQIGLMPMRQANRYFLMPFFRYGTRLWGKPAVFIKLKNGLLRRIIILTPEYPEIFVENVLQKLPDS